MTKTSGKSLRTASIAAEIVGNFVLVAETRETPTDEEWQQNLALQTSIPADRARVLVWTEGGAPNAKQRAMLNAALNGAQPLSALLTPSKLARTIGTAIKWFNPRLRIFAPHQIEAALDHLCVPIADRQLLKDTLKRLRSEVAHGRDARAQNPA